MLVCVLTQLRCRQVADFIGLGGNNCKSDIVMKAVPAVGLWLAVFPSCINKDEWNEEGGLLLVWNPSKADYYSQSIRLSHPFVNVLFSWPLLNQPTAV